MPGFISNSWKFRRKLRKQMKKNKKQRNRLFSLISANFCEIWKFASAAAETVELALLRTICKVPITRMPQELASLPIRNTDTAHVNAGLLWLASNTTQHANKPHWKLSMDVSQCVHQT